MMEKLSTFIRAGSMKLCYALPGNRVALVAAKGILLQEQRALRQLQLWGVPVLETRLRQFIDEKDEKCWGLEAERYDFHMLGFSTPKIPNPNESAHDAFLQLRPGHLRGLKRIRDCMVDAHLDVEDPQFLFRGDSEVVVCDPYNVFVGSPGAGTRKMAYEIGVILKSYQRWLKSRQNVVEKAA